MTRFTAADRARFLILALTMLAFGLRLWQIDTVPPGWSDDELSNAFVMSQKILQGDYSVYYVDATGHEALYHVLAAVPMQLIGYNVIGIRLLSIVLGTLTVPLTYALGRRLFGRRVGLIAAATLAAGFWSLIYSRANLRHISMPVFMLVAFVFFWRGLETGDRSLKIDHKSPISNLQFLLSGIAMGLGFYTYFAARGVPGILLVFCLYLALADWDLLKRKWRGIALAFLVAAVLAVPLVVSLQRQTGADARVAEVAVPLVEARQGNFERLREHVVVTLSMFHGDGDDEFLYNIPHRPVFGLVGALFFWMGVLIALWHTLTAIVRKVYSTFRTPHSPFHPPVHERAGAFVLLWWLAGITPGFISVPAGSLSHTIAAQSATYLLAALPLWALSRRLSRSRARLLVPLLGLVLVGSVLLRDLPDYFREWPHQGNTRFLYHADMRDVAHYLSRHPELDDFAISGLLSGPWDKLALAIDLENAGAETAQPRWYDPRRAILLQLEGTPAVAFAGYPVVDTLYGELLEPVPGETAGGYRLARVRDVIPAGDEPVCFQNGLCLLAANFDAASGRLELTWRATRPVDLPPLPIVSKPPPPDVYDGPRLLVFSQLLDEAGNFLVGDDGLWVDPATLQAGDVFRQQHRLPTPAGETPTTLLFGLYDPMTGDRILTIPGRDHLRLDLSDR